MRQLTELITLFICFLVVASCSPLRHIQTTEQVDSTAIDKSVIMVKDTITQVVNQVVTQTVIEYYPVYDTVYIEASKVAVPIPSEVPSSIPQPIKSITQTEIHTEMQSSAQRDSITLKNTATRLDKEVESETVDSAPSSVRVIRYIVLLLMLLCILIIVIKIRIR